MPLRLVKKACEKWRDCVERIATENGLEKECLEQFDKVMERGITSEEVAAWEALYDWDCLEYVKESNE